MQTALNKIFKLTELDWKWQPSSYSDFSISEQDDLIAISKEEHLDDKLEEDLSDAEYNATIHAYRALASLNQSEHIPHFLNLLTHPSYDDNDYFTEDIPTILAQYGTAAIQPVIDTLNNQNINEITRMPIVDALEKLAENTIDAPGIIKALTDYLQEKHFTRTLNAHIIAGLVDLKQADEIETIRASYAAHLVDITMSGDLEEIELDLGIRSERETKRKNIQELEAEELHLAIKEDIGPRPDDDDIASKLVYIMSLYGRECSIQGPDALHGFLCGVLLAPRFILPSEYMPVVWDINDTASAYTPHWENKDDAEFFLQILMAMHNSVASDLKTNDLKTLHDFHHEDEKTPVYAGWILGLVRGVNLWQESTDYLMDMGGDVEQLIELSAKIIAGEFDAGIDGSIPETSELFNELKQHLYVIYQKNAKSSNLLSPSSNPETYHREQPKISRNAPCPCGSGKKYKRCCLN